MKKPRSKIAQLICIMLIAIFAISTINAAAGESVALSCEGSGSQGDIVELQIVLSVPEQIRGLEVKLHYDSDRLEFVKNGSTFNIHDAGSMPAFEPDKFPANTISFGVLNCSSNGEVDVATLKFRIKTLIGCILPLTYEKFTVAYTSSPYTAVNVNVNAGIRIIANGGGEVLPTPSPSQTSAPTAPPISATASPMPEASPTPLQTIEPTATPTATNTATPTVTNTATAMPTATPKPTARPSNSDGDSGGGGGGGAYIPIQTPAPTAQGEPVKIGPIFSDTENFPWAMDSISFLAEKGIVKGTSENTFSPQTSVKRGDFMVMMIRLLGMEGNAEDNFSDVPEGSYYYNHIGIAKKEGLATGIGDNQFAPEANIKRQDIFVLAYRILVKQNRLYAAKDQDMAALDQFTDKEEVADYAKQACAKMVQLQVVKGSGNQLYPKDFATRAETAVMISRIYNLLQ